MPELKWPLDKQTLENEILREALGLAYAILLCSRRRRLPTAASA